MLQVGGYFSAVEQGFFIDSGNYPERNGDGIARHIDGGVGVGTVVERDKDYMAPVCQHFGYNNLPLGLEKPCDLIDGCTFCNPEKIVYIDELDENDNAASRFKENKEFKNTNLLKPEVEWAADGIVSTTIFLPVNERIAEFAAIEIGKKMGLLDVVVIHKQMMQHSEGTLVEIKGKVPFSIDLSTLVIPEKPMVLSDDLIRNDISEKPMKIVAATVGQDEHSVGLREIIDIKHGGIERYGIECNYFGTSCLVEKLVDAAIEINADAILISTIISHNDMHLDNMGKLNQLCIEKGVRDKMILVGGGTQVSNEMAVKAGLDAGFGRGTHGNDVASFLVKKRREMMI